ncbi:NADAR family protein [Sulfitobacter mediterraneus]|uniref:NADAR family protein n=1 Tax=Sulfitobacter mediterraneus TaxID=83219 RepID=UPI0019344667|nr:NADAR family protein [Sulfitobacter mediterraneus]MBM1632318.1 NADAR family protein [Sulfitobacter mediterraneus]MBM1640134.1 NADAR family protein [Sulfitobacter mediterraneus]MBM1644183.1 NADAR family protein [Sulfitobacter mediterraneus]MBM1648229.1 NADAR family protein [Sulfitobacter mediterraneus]MBM1652274.1 NADAR family protein [Sulfitobacter mediterraneus]
MTIYFYAQTDPYAEFSNFAPFGVEMDELWWPTVEHYFQAQKFTDAVYQERIRRAIKPKDAKALGMTRALPLRSDWEDTKVTLMHSAVACKFKTHPKPRDLLLSTGTEDIVENAPMDSFWGCGPDGQGANMLGKILMQVRSDLQDAAA